MVMHTLAALQLVSRLENIVVVVSPTDSHVWPVIEEASEPSEDAKGVERKPIDIGDVWFDTVVNGDPRKGEDSQKQLHSDIFFTTHKVWFFLEPVKLEDGPLCFAPGTNRVTWKRLVFEYSKSIKYDQLSDYSFRVEPADKAYFGFEEKSLTCPANTLVIANTCGFHRRGDAVAGHTRKQIHFCIRSQPFAFV